MRGPQCARTGLPRESGPDTRAKSAACPCRFASPTRGDIPFTAAEEAELAVGLLNVSGSRELDQFLGDLIQQAARAAGGVGSPQLGRALGGILKGIARSTLPTSVALSGAATTRDGGPVVRTPFESKTPDLISEEREFEAARRFVRFAGSAARGAARVPRKVPPALAARTAVVSAARRHAPRLLGWRKRRWRKPGSARPCLRRPCSPTTRPLWPPVCKCNCRHLFGRGRKVVVITL